MFSAKRLIRKIKEFRKRNKLTQSAFAKQIGTSSATISKWERETINFNPGLAQIVGIAKAMGITPSELLSQGKNTANASVADNDKKTPEAVKKPQPKKKAAAAASAKEKKQSKRTVKTSKTAVASREIKVKRSVSSNESVKRGRKTSAKAAKASIVKTAATPTKNETSKRKPGRPKKQPKA